MSLPPALRRSQMFVIRVTFCCESFKILQQSLTHVVPNSPGRNQDRDGFLHSFGKF